MELSLKKLFGDSRYLIQSIHAKKLQVRIFSRLGWISPLLKNISMTFYDLAVHIITKIMTYPKYCCAFYHDKNKTDKME